MSTATYNNSGVNVCSTFKLYNTFHQISVCAGRFCLRETAAHSDFLFIGALEAYLQVTVSTPPAQITINNPYSDMYSYSHQCECGFLGQGPDKKKFTITDTYYKPNDLPVAKCKNLCMT